MITVDVAELEAAWRPLTESEKELAERKLRKAVVMLYRLRTDIGEAIEEDEIFQEAVTDVVCEMVKRAMKQPDDQPDNLSSTMQVAGPYTVQNAFRDTGGALYLTRLERRILGVRRKGSMTDITGATAA